MKAASLFFLILSILCYLFVGIARAQVATCGATVPFYTADVRVSHTWTSPSHSRKGNCCSTGGSDRCTSFRVLTDTLAVLLRLEIIAGSIPSGALYYQIGCGPMLVMGEGVWLNAMTSYDITFCKPGNNPNIYQINVYSRSDTVVNGTFSAYTCGQTDLDIGVPGGVWSSSNTGVATVDASTGVVTGITAGTSTISYVLNTVLLKTVTVTINPTPPITGTFTVCVGGTTALSNAASSSDPSCDVWTSSNAASAPISSSGVVSGVSVGTSSISYTMCNGCRATAIVTVTQTVPPVTGGPVCVSSTTTMGNATSGGTWSSGSTGVATIGSASGLASGVSSGTSNITYTITGGCRNSGVLTVNALPSAISGPSTVCVSNPTTLSDATSGGTWSSSNGSVATIGSSSGVVSGVAAGTTLITYTTAAGCRATKALTINNAPVISGMTPVCVGSTISLSASIAGGTWSNANGKASINSSTGVMTGNAAGTVMISYQLANGCLDAIAATINPLPAAISGPSTVCTGSTITQTDATAGGTWSSSNGSVATIGLSSGVASGVGAGTATISYTLTATGCKVTRPVTVNATPVISGSPQLCLTSTATLNSSIAGGTWSTGDSAVAFIGSSSGVVTTVALGTTSITYQLATGCRDIDVVTVNPQPASITGPMTICSSNQATLSNASAGGTWSSKNSSIAAVDAVTGIVSGVAAGQTYISYILPTGCWTRSQVTVNASPVITEVAPAVCVSSTVSLTANIPGGTWSSSDISIASIAASGVATGLLSGSAIISYQLGNGCMDTTLLTVGALPVAISGAPVVCSGAATTYSNSIAGGSWTSSDLTVGSIGAATGVFNGAGAGTTTITYATPSGCRATKDVTVSPAPTITMAGSVCTGNSIPFSCSVSGGTWSCSDPSKVSINAALGTLSGVAAGTTIVSYSLGAACGATNPVVVHQTPTISGAPEVCAGSSVALSNDVPGGSWSCAGAAIGSIDPVSGVFSGTTNGSTMVSYICPAGCPTARAMNVNQLPTLTGRNYMCINLTTQLASDMTGGAWTSGRPDTASVNATGLVTGLGGGTAIISYTTAQGCVGTKQVRVNTYFYPLETSPLSTPLRTNICLTTNLQLNSPYGGSGTWRSADTTVATVSNFVPGSTVPWGLVHSVSLGTVTISYTAANGCTSTHTITINPMPVITSGPTTVCRYGYVTLNATPAVGGPSTGQWISHQLTTCQVGSYTGVVHASTVGVAEIAYRTFQYDACGATILVTVNACTPKVAGGATADPNGYSIYPNPGTGKFTITQEVITDQQLHTVVTNCLGQSVFDGKISFVGGEGTLEVPYLSPGVYFVQLEGKVEERAVLRLTVQ